MSMERRTIHYDYEVELPSTLWAIGLRTLKLRTHVEVRGVEGDRGFIVQTVERVVSHEVEPEDHGA